VSGDEHSDETVALSLRDHPAGSNAESLGLLQKSIEQEVVVDNKQV
jgi:hypothetical protein